VLDHPPRILVGDNLPVLRAMPSQSVDAVVTDPPYGLRFLGNQWDADVPSTDVWRECLRVLRPGGHLLSFGGTRTYHRMARAVEQAGFEIRDMLMWIYGQGMPKHKHQLKPAHEPIVMARAPLDGTIDETIARHGTGGLNVDACRVPTSESQSRDGEASAKRCYRERGATNFGGRPGTRGGDARGRYPANVLHDGSESVRAEFPVTRSGRISGTIVSNGWSGGWTPRTVDTFADAGSAVRFFYAAKPHGAERDHGLDAFAGWDDATRERAGLPSHSSRLNPHPTVKPVELMRYLVTLVCPVGGVVLDPYAGSGSTLIGSMLARRRSVGIELETRHALVAHLRARAWRRGPPSAASKPSVPEGQLGLL